MMAGSAGGGPLVATAHLAPDESHGSAAAYVLDALTDDERQRFLDHAWSCAECQREVRELGATAALLPRLYDDRIFESVAPVPGLGDGLRERILAAAAAEPPARVAVGTVIPPRESVTPTPISRGSRRSFHPAWPLAALFALCTAGALAWGVEQRQAAEDTRAELERMRSTMALAVFLAPTDDGPATAHGRVALEADGEAGVLAVRGLPGLEPGRDYQVWLVDEAGPRPAGVFDVDSRGDGGLVIEPDGGEIRLIALTEEPDGGSEAPTSAVLLAGDVGAESG